VQARGRRRAEPRRDFPPPLARGWIGLGRVPGVPLRVTPGCNPSRLRRSRLVIGLTGRSSRAHAGVSQLIAGGRGPQGRGYRESCLASVLADYRKVQLFSSVSEAGAYAHESAKRRVLVPTMGALHRGHLELIRIAREAAGKEGEVAVSIFVNPLQFAPGGDYEKYPRPEVVDEEFCRSAGVDILFRPTPAEMYAADFSVAIEENSLSTTLCGKSRPGHFRGVCTVVAKLFHLVAPDTAVFGEKDFQQLAIIRRMVRDLNFQIEIIGAPTVRESDGLACSSRNQYLGATERQQAPVLRAALIEGAQLAAGGERSTSVILEAVRKLLDTSSVARIDYLELVNADTLQSIGMVQANSLIALAGFFGQTRLIDNIRIP
jgi:pantoate--beta-alanine ligase